MATPNAYASASVKPRTLPGSVRPPSGRAAPCPTMIDDRIGSIGSTQGVKLSSRPSAKKIGSTENRDRDLNAVSSRFKSVGGVAGEAIAVPPPAGVAMLLDLP